MSELIECLDGLTAEDIIRRVAKTANGMPFYLQVLGGGYTAACAEYQAVYDSLTTKPSNDIAAQQDIMVCGLVTDGVWAKLDVFYMFAQTTNADSEALKNWTNPGTFDAVLGPTGDPVFVALEGFTGASAQYIDCNWNPTADGVNYTQNSASIGIYLRTNSASNQYDLGINSAADVYIQSRRATNNAAHAINDATLDSFANADSRGMFIGSRTASDVKKLYRNKIALINDVTVSTGVPDGELFVFRYGAVYSIRQASVVFAGSGFTQSNIDDMNDRFETYMDSNGKGVIP